MAICVINTLMNVKQEFPVPLKGLIVKLITFRNNRIDGGPGGGGRFEPMVWPHPGDEVSVSAQGVGTLTNSVKPEAP
jgi:hypothetical protein